MINGSLGGADAVRNLLGGRLRILYLVHDLHDLAVARRIRMLQAVGGEVHLAGFRRLETVPAAVAGVPAIDLGRTHDAQLFQRVLAVLRNLVRPDALLPAAKNCDVIIARNLETLALAARIGRAVPDALQVYECLDIHRLLLSRSMLARILQALESRLLAQVDLLITSSPAFQREYFSKRATLTARSLLLENKLLALGGAVPKATVAPDGPPWVVGWFGMLRCSKTFEILSDLARRFDGRVVVHVAGRPSPAIFPDFEQRIAASPYVHYLGPYAPEDLPRLYAACHFAWAIDYFEEGLNSRWLLPNRLYEALACGSVPVALASVETGRWLEAHGAGVVLGDELEELDFFGTLTAQSYAAARAAVQAIPTSEIVAGESDAQALIDAIHELHQ